MTADNLTSRGVLVSRALDEVEELAINLTRTLYESLRDH
jgi:hypothetical protein